MEDYTTQEKAQNLEKKLLKTQKRSALLTQKVKLLEEMVQDAKLREDDARTRASDASSLMHELLERQRELNVMLNRSNTLLAHVYEANKMLAVECHDAIQALPAPKKAELEKTMSKVEELFKKTGVPDAETSETLVDQGDFQDETLVTPPVSEETISSSWSAESEYQPQLVEAELVDEDQSRIQSLERKIEQLLEDNYIEQDYSSNEEETKRKWWDRFKIG